MNIGIDIDDTISNTYEIQFNLAQQFTIEKLGRSGYINRNENFSYHYYCQAFHGWTDEENKKFWYENYDKILNLVKAKYYAKEVIKKLKDEGNNIIIITARFKIPGLDVEKVTKKWLKENEIVYDKLIIDAKDKGKVAKENEIDIFIDDCLENCIEVQKKSIKAYIMDSQTNQRKDENNIKRIYSWAHLYQEISKLKEEI